MLSMFFLKINLVYIFEKYVYENSNIFYYFSHKPPNNPILPALLAWKSYIEQRAVLFLQAGKETCMV